VDLLQVKQEIGERICLMGGVNSGSRSPSGMKERSRRSIRLEILAPGGGFILCPVGAVFSTSPGKVGFD
jgi:hypothetical protein